MMSPARIIWRNKYMPIKRIYRPAFTILTDGAKPREDTQNEKTVMNHRDEYVKTNKQ